MRLPSPWRARNDAFCDLRGFVFETKTDQMKIEGVEKVSNN
jgi:hypothetical protein